MRIDEAVERFRRAAIEKGDFAEPASRDHSLHAEMSAAWNALDAHGEEGRMAFRTLLSDESAYVRLWVGSQLLALGDQGGLPVLEACVREEKGLLQFTALMALQEWRAGRLKGFTRDE